MSEYSTYQETKYMDDLDYCKQFIFSFGSNYALGTRLFPKQVREATIFFYAFVRYADELVDNPDQKMDGQTHANINEFKLDWQKVLDNGPSKETHPILRSNYWLIKKYSLPTDYYKDFLSAMIQDITKERYGSYAELEHYMWGSASVVGHVMTFIVGYNDQSAFDDARALGEAMQLANFLRDVNEDYLERNRIYLPLNDMAVFGIDEEVISIQIMTERLRNFIVHYVERTEKLFDQGIAGIRKLKQGKFSILLASRMYRENIRTLKKRDYDIFGPKIRLSKFTKFWILITTFFVYPIWVAKNKS